jgi:hypothetical protein
MALVSSTKSSGKVTPTLSALGSLRKALTVPGTSSTSFFKPEPKSNLRSRKNYEKFKKKKSLLRRMEQKSLRKQSQ